MRVSVARVLAPSLWNGLERIDVLVDAAAFVDEGRTGRICVRV